MGWWKCLERRQVSALFSLTRRKGRVSRRSTDQVRWEVILFIESRIERVTVDNWVAIVRQRNLQESHGTFDRLLHIECVEFFAHGFEGLTIDPSFTGVCLLAPFLYFLQRVVQLHTSLIVSERGSLTLGAHIRLLVNVELTVPSALAKTASTVKQIDHCGGNRLLFNPVHVEDGDGKAGQTCQVAHSQWNFKSLIEFKAKLNTSEDLGFRHDAILDNVNFNVYLKCEVVQRLLILELRRSSLAQCAIDLASLGSHRLGL